MPGREGSTHSEPVASVKKKGVESLCDASLDKVRATACRS